MKPCTSCHIPKPDSDFSSNGIGQRKSRCKLCLNADERKRVHLINDHGPLLMLGWPVPQ